MIDVHCHLNLKAFKDDYDEAIHRAQKAGVKTIINTGTKLDTSRKAVELAEKYKNLYAIVGVHPHHADKIEKNWLEELEKLATHPKVVAIGEVGLDYYSYASNGIVDKTVQKDVFLKQIELAQQYNLALQIHNRHAGEDILDILEAHKKDLQSIPGMFHCFAGTTDVLKRALDLGFYIGFDGNVTYEGLAPGETVALKELASLTPLDRIVTETDSPFLTPQPHRGSRNEPSYVILVGKFLAEIKGVSFEEFQAKTVKNAQTVFHLP